MFRLVEKIANVNNCGIFKNDIMFVQNGSFYIGKKNFKIVPILYKSDVTNNNIWIKDEKWGNYLLNFTTGSLEELPFNLGLNGVITDVLTIFSDNTLYCYSTVRRKFIINFPKNENIKSYLSKGKSIFCQIEIFIKSLSLLTGEYEWEVNLSEYGDIRSVLAAVQDNLWVLTNDYKNNRHSLLRLDANSGRVMQVLGEGLKLSDAYVKYIEEKQTLLSFKSSISSVPSPSTLIEIDAKTGEILRNVTVESMLEPNLKVGLWQYHNNQLFFTANTTMMTTTHIGVLDYDTLKLLWYTEVLDRKGLLKDIQVSSDKIYVLDQVGTLHIFEKEIN